MPFNRKPRIIGQHRKEEGEEELGNATTKDSSPDTISSRARTISPILGPKPDDGNFTANEDSFKLSPNRQWSDDIGPDHVICTCNTCSSRERNIGSKAEPCDCKTCSSKIKRGSVKAEPGDSSFIPNESLNNQCENNVWSVNTARKKLVSYWDLKKIKVHKVPSQKKRKFVSYWDLKKEFIKFSSKSYGTFVPSTSPSSEIGRDSFEYKMCPTFSEKQQCLSEYSLPLILPAMFYAMKLSSFSLKWCYILVVGHTVETSLTNFGPSVDHFRVSQLISPLWHHMLDCGWLHSLISAMLLAPYRFTLAADTDVDVGIDADASVDATDEESQVTIIALLLIQTLPIYLAVSFKTHYLRKSDDCQNYIISSESMMGKHIRRCFVWYLAATTLIWMFLRSPLLLKAGVLCLNIVPLGLARVYTTQIVRYIG